MNLLKYGSREVRYTVERRERTTLEISVYPDCEVEVIAPMEASDAAIEVRVRKRLRWITRQQRAFENFFPKPSPREYVSGESWLYQGRQYRLKALQAEASPKVALRRPFIAVEASNPKDSKEVKKLLDAWYRSRAEERLTARYKVCSQQIEAYGIEAPEMRLQSMPKRWGSYTPSARILLNPELVKAPTECIDYVILHELCHAKHRNHDRNFYKLLNRVVPDWLRLKYKLEHLIV
jgi:predicted metal-dependent hydrolase